MTITEWFCRAVTAGLMPEYKNISVNAVGTNIHMIYDVDTDNLITTVYTIQTEGEDDSIQLRKDGKDLYSLEWRKPTKQDVGRMCWCNQSYCGRFELLYQKIYEDSDISNCLADHGAIAPTEADFLKAYGE
jgi:hypothetical protein